MKAKEYIKKYPQWNFMAANNFFHDLCNEVARLTHERRCAHESALRSVILEINNIWNTVARLSNGQLRRDGFIVLYLVRNKELRQLFQNLAYETIMNQVTKFEKGQKSE